MRLYDRIKVYVEVGCCYCPNKAHQRLNGDGVEEGLSWHRLREPNIKTATYATIPRDPIQIGA